MENTALKYGAFSETAALKDGFRDGPVGELLGEPVQRVRKAPGRESVKGMQ